MKRHYTLLLMVVAIGWAAAGVRADDAAVEMLTPENMRAWQQDVDSRYAGSIAFDESDGVVRFNTFDQGGHARFYDGDDQRDDFRIDCVVSFHSLEDKYSGLSIHLREDEGERYWVYWRPKNRGLYALKVRAGSPTIPEFDAGLRQADRPGAIELNRDYTFSVEIVGRRIRAWIDGKQLLEFVDPMSSMYPRGRFGLAVQTTDLTIKSLKVTNLSESEPLPVASYVYVNAPESGDETGTLLTDGRINGKESQALWWLATKGDPAIVFDLGEQHFINAVRLKAFASPDSNISAYRVFGSSDGEQWRVLASEVNESSDPREQEQTLEAQCAGLARYVKVMLFRSAGDATIKLDEVQILGRAARPDDVVAADDDKPYYEGDPIAPATLDGPDDDNWFYLEGGAMRVAISRLGGYLGPLFNRTDGQRCTMVAYDSYIVETRNSEREISERDNRIVDIARDGQSLTLTCRNPGLDDIDIIQTYRATEHGISKTTEMINRGTAPDLFVTVRTGAILDEQFRDGGWYIGADRGLGGRMAASQVTLDMTPTCHSPKNTKVVLFMDYERGYGIGQFRHQINGEYCNPVTSRYFEKTNHPPIYTSNGWKLGLITLHLEPALSRSVQVRWNLFEEDEFNFFKQYTSIPEVHERFGVERPDWLLRLKSSFSTFGSYLFSSPHNRDVVMAALKRTTDLYDDGYIYYLVTAGNVWGDWHQGEPWNFGWCGNVVNNDYVRQTFDALREQSPSLKVGVYTWAWTGWRYADSYIEHPEWYIDRNKEGYFKKGYQNGRMNYVRRISAAGCMDDLLSSVDAIIEQFDPDHFYIDGGGGGSNLIDWQRLALDYDTDWQRFHWGIFNATRKHDGRERVMFTNSRSEGFVDIGFYEGINNVLSENTWRESGDALLALKMRNSVFPKITYMPIYWRTNTLPFYSNYCIGLGLVPENIYPSRELRNVAYVTAAYETRMFKFVLADLQPDWRRDVDVEVEAYTLTHEPAAIFSVVNHSKLPIPQTVSADAGRLGIDTTQPIFSWLIRMYDSRLRETGVSERTAKAVYQRTGWGIDLVAAPHFRGMVEAQNGRLIATESFDRNVLNMVTFSNCPAVVYATNGRRRQLWQPNTRGITVHGELRPADRTIALTTEPNNTADVQTAELLVYVPNDWRDLQVTGATTRRVVLMDGQRFLLLDVEGFGRINITAGRTEPFEVAARQPLDLPDTTAPGMLSLNLPDGTAAVTIYYNDVPVYFGDTDEIELPQELASGTYRVDAVIGDVLYSGQATIASDWLYDYAPLQPQRGPSHLEQTAVDRTVDGLHVLSSATHSHDDVYLPHFTEVNADELSFAAGSPDVVASRGGFAAAGLEIEDVRVVELDVRNTFFRRWANYDRDTFRPGSSEAFAGLLVDYHTADGYTKRVGLSMGLVQPQSQATQPSYGKHGKVDLFVRLEDYIHQSNRAQFALDLARWAPNGWDGRVWLSAATNGGVFPGRKLFVTITGTGEGGVKVPWDHGQIMTRELNQPHIDVPTIESAVTIDGRLDEPAWDQAVTTDAFTLTTSMRPPMQSTRMSLFRDATNLYIGVRCDESQREHLIDDGEKIWSHDAIDVTFAPLPINDRLHKFIVNFENKFFEQTMPLSEVHEQWGVATAARQDDGAWFVEMAIPMARLELNDGKIAFNLLRYRPDPTGTPAFSWSLIPLESYRDPQWFGTLGF